MRTNWSARARKLGEPRIDRRPVAKYLKPRRFAGREAGFEMKRASITNVVDEIDVDVRHPVEQPHPAGVGESISFALEHDELDRRAAFEQDPCSVQRNAGSASNVAGGQAVPRASWTTRSTPRLRAAIAAWKNNGENASVCACWYDLGATSRRPSTMADST